MNVVTVEREIAGRTLTLQTGKLARQSHGAVWVRYGDTVVLSTVLSAPSTRDIDFFPLYVDYREATYSAGKIPGGFFKREGRPSTQEVLTMRMIDRPIRPLFPADFQDEVQIQCLTLSYDGENEPDVLALIGASAALVIGHTPFQGPVGAARVGLVDGELAIFPTTEQIETGGMDLVVVGPPDAVNMIELAGREVPEDVVAAGIEKGFEVCRTIMDMIRELDEKYENPLLKSTYEPKPVPQELKDALAAKYGDRIRQAKQIRGKVERGDALSAIKEEVMAEYFPPDAPADFKPAYSEAHVSEALYKTEGDIQRELILGGQRPDGRAMDEVRPLAVEVGVLPRTHGSALFARGETQAMVMATLGTPRDQTIIDGIREEVKKPFYLHYNFPPFSVGEIRPIRGPGRREIGHGMLAENALQAIMPTSEQFPYTVRVVAEILESNGSTSQAAICGASLALMDAGVPVKAAVAGISIGMVSKDDRYLLLTDIVGEEDFHGDMDFKVAGTREGITAIQLDMKSRGIVQSRVVETLERARVARLFLLEQMNQVIAEPRVEISRYAPRMIMLKIDTEKIGKVIGPGGKMINRIQDETGAVIEIEDDGRVFIACVEAEGAEAAKKAVEGLTAEAEIGKIYEGKVVSIRDFGAFVEILPGQDGMCHVSELDDKYIKQVTDAVNVGDVVKVKVVSVDDQGRIRLSRKAAIMELRGEVYEPPPRSSSGPRRPRGKRPGRDGGGRRGD